MRHVWHDAMPTEDEIKDAATKSRSSSTSTASSFSLSNDGEKNGFLLLQDSENSNRDANVDGSKRSGSWRRILVGIAFGQTVILTFSR